MFPVHLAFNAGHLARGGEDAEERAAAGMLEMKQAGADPVYLSSNKPS